ncbi:MAG: hypothetical protein CL862_00675 [Cyanobium sp. NAT70]|nr:hypothetical protein [Cyanobium sp. NAT70]|tara:strand:+ start:1538 stop:1942 length:405 start_codon:yes stop_codon:yes gene_type:complete
MSSSHDSVTLRPDPRLPLWVVALGLALLPLPWHPWPTFVISLFGLFLLIQTVSLRLEFEERALIVWQNGRELRRFPYDQWLAWRLFASWLPGLFYFRETKSIHFLPILFSPKELKEQLETRLAPLQQPKKNSNP